VRATRRGLLDLLTQVDLDLSDIIAARLEDPRWYVQRNMLVLLKRRGEVPEGLSLTRWTSHPDGRVRVEAIRAQLLTPAGHNPAVLTALNDADPRIVTLGLREAVNQCPPEALRRVTELALEPDADDGLRSLAVTALGRIQKPQALSALLRLSDGGRSFLGRRRLPAQTPVLVASIKALAQQWSGHPSAVSILAVAARSSDPELRLAAQGTRS
jgi:HEAT repeat protein